MLKNCGVLHLLIMILLNCLLVANADNISCDKLNHLEKDILIVQKIIHALDNGELDLKVWEALVNSQNLENALKYFLKCSKTRASHNNVCSLSNDLKKEIHGYQPIVDKIIDTVVNGKFKGEVWEAVANITDKFGSRLTGSKNLENAIDYVIEEMKNFGLENVRTENVNITPWIRGKEEATLISPHNRKLSILGLGSSVGTPPEGILGDVVVVKNFHVLKKMNITGKILLVVPKWKGYFKTVKYRHSAVIGAKMGALAVLVKSITPFSIYSPHAGTVRYEKGIKKIPSASLTVEDSEMILRMYNRGERIVIHLLLNDKNLSPVTSRNTIAELIGTNPNGPVAAVGGHIDSWDVGVGAMDDGGGAYIAWKSLQFLKALNLRPRRTIRSILFTGEEQGFLGALDYKKKHFANAKAEFNFFLESDMGVFDPRGLLFSGNKQSECIIREILSLMKSINATSLRNSAESPDFNIWIEDGFPVASLDNANEKYFWYHHTQGDSMLVLDSHALDKGAALWASLLYIISDLSVELPKDFKYVP